MTSEQLDELEHLARTSGRKLHPDKALALITAIRSEMARANKAEDHAQQVSTFAAKMIGNACERHANAIQKMSFNEFYREMPRSCHWCADERVTALEAQIERLTVAARDFLDHHSLDCGAHYCRYCSARSPEWNHESCCAYVRSQSAYTALSAVLAEAPKEGQ